MKNAIKYYYNLNVIDIHQINKIYKFHISNMRYLLCPITRNIEEIRDIYELHLYLNALGIYCHKIILNINNEIITTINEVAYVLLIVSLENKKIDIQDILYLSNVHIKENSFKRIQRKRWNLLWIDKVDYIEYQISQFRKKYPLIRESSDYYIGIVENCISLFNNLNISNSILVVSHTRLTKNTTTDEFYNPLNFIIDNKVRDISEYIKSLMLEENVIEYIKKYIYYNQLDKDNILLLFIRLMYPSSYFDVCELIINNKLEEKNLNKIISANENYENSIKKIYNYLRSISELPEVEWLMKN